MNHLSINQSFDELAFDDIFHLRYESIFFKLLLRNKECACFLKRGGKNYPKILRNFSLIC